MRLRVLHQDEFFVAVDKPAGFHVHPPEAQEHRISRNTNCLRILRDQLGKYLYPVHRLDRATSGVLLFGLSSEAASRFNAMFEKREIHKTYFAVTRGWLPDEGEIDHPLSDGDEDSQKKASLTRFLTVGRTELPISSGPHSTSRYTLVRVHPLTGRMHQIRKHFSHLSHPLIGDTVYGDGKHNRIFRDLLRERKLLLKAHSLRFNHPMTGAPIILETRWEHAWHQVFELFGVCPLFRDSS